MFDYAILQIVFALFLMSIPMGFATAIGWCDPIEHRRRPVLFAVSAVFSGLGIFMLIRLVIICINHLTRGQNLINSATGLFNAIYAISFDNETIRFAEDQIHALVFASVSIVFTVVAFLLSIFFFYVLFFRIALIVDKKLRNGVRYGALAGCLVFATLVGVITSQYAIMGIAIGYIVVSAAFLVFGNWRLMRSGDETIDEVSEITTTTRKNKRKQAESNEAEDMAQEAREFFGNTDNFKF